MERSYELLDYVNPKNLADTGMLLNSFSYSMVSCMLWTIQEPWHLETRTVPDSFFLFPINGALKFSCRDKNYDVPAGSFIMLADGTEHEIKMKKGSKNLEQISLHCTIMNRWNVPLLSLFEKPVGKLDHPEVWYEKLKILTSIQNHSPAAGQELGQAFLKELLLSQHLGGNKIRPRAKEGDPRMVMALQYIQENIHKNVNVDELAALCKMSTVQFRKIFKKNVYSSPKNYIAKYQIQLACKLLKESQKSLKDISAESGFQSIQYFHLVFKKIFNRTPTDYRDQPHV